MELNKKFQESLDLRRNTAAARFRKIENVQQILWIQNNQIPPFYIEGEHKHTNFQFFAKLVLTNREYFRKRMHFPTFSLFFAFFLEKLLLYSMILYVEKK